MENSVEVPQKTENRTSIWSSNSTSGYISKGNENRILIPCTPTFTAALFTIAKRKKQPKCQSMDDERIKKMRPHTHTHTLTHRGILSSHEKEGNPAIFNNMHGPSGHYANWNKPDRERQILCDIIYMWNLKKKSNSKKQEVEKWLPGAGGEGCEK